MKTNLPHLMINLIAELHLSRRCFMQQIISIAMLLTLALPSQAGNVTQINRYSTVSNKPLTAQINPLKAVQQMHFPVSIQTIGKQ